METLARFRPDPHLLAAYAEIEGEEGEDEPPLGELPRTWLASRAMGTARVSGRFALPGHSNSLASLRRRLAASIIHHGLEDLDASTVRLSAPRAFTQEISRLVFECTSPDGAREFAGIQYASRLGDELDNLAIFETPDALGLLAVERAGEPLEAGDPDLLGVMALLGLRFPPT